MGAQEMPCPKRERLEDLEPRRHPALRREVIPQFSRRRQRHGPATLPEYVDVEAAVGDGRRQIPAEDLRVVAQCDPHVLLAPRRRHWLWPEDVEPDVIVARRRETE